MISIDTEDTGVDFFHGVRPFFVTLCRENGDQRWWEWEVNPLTRKPIVPIEELHQIQAEIDAADIIVGHNIRFDVKALIFAFQDAGLQLRWDWAKTRCSLTAGHILASNQPHNLTDMVAHYLGYDMEPLETALEKAVKQGRNYCGRYLKSWRIAKKGMKNVPSASKESWRCDYWLPAALAMKLGYPEWITVLRDYANVDSATSLALWKVLETELRARKLWAIFENRMKLSPITNELETRGVTVNKRRIDELNSKFLDKMKDAETACVAVAKNSYGYDLDMPNGPVNGSLTRFAFDVLKLPVVKRTDSGNPSLDSKVAVPQYLDTLQPGSNSHTFIKNIAKARKRHTSISFLENYLHFGIPTGNPGSWLRLHTSANFCGTDTTRWSFKTPNTANVSHQEMECLDCDGEGCEECNFTGIESFNLRYCFGPAAGREWWSFDYENLELRIPAYRAPEQAMIDLFEKPNDPPFFGSYHLLNASIIYPDLFWPLAEQKGEFKRRYASTNYTWTKSCGFLLQYGGQARKFDQTARRAGAFEKVRERLPRLMALADTLTAFANRHGYVETLPDKDVDPSRGYPIMVPRSENGKVMPTKPLAYQVQSTAMACTNKAMLRWEPKLKGWRKEGFDAFNTLQVHDELVCDMPKGDNRAKALELKELMEKSGDDIGVPLRVSCKLHRKVWSEEDKQ